MQLPYPIYCAQWDHTAAFDWSIGPTTHDLDVVLRAPVKIAALSVMCNVPTDFSFREEYRDLDLGQFDLVVLSDIEYRPIDKIKSWIEHNQIKNYVLAVGGTRPTEELDTTTMVYRPWWCYNLFRFNKYESTVADNKPFHYDLLLGARRPHRDYAMLAFQKSGLIESSIVNYRHVFVGERIDGLSQSIATHFAGTELAWPYISPNLDPDWEVKEEITNAISPFMPWEMYRRCNYTVVCETLEQGNTFFFSEKTTKPLFAKRIFLLFGIKDFLLNLRKLGFATFDNIIDESYDQETDSLARYEKVFEQIELLAKQDPNKVYSQVADRLEHNHQLVQTLKLQTTTRMHELLASKLG